MSKVWSWIEKNRWSVIMPLVAIVLWLVVGVACIPTTTSPIRPDVLVTAEELQLDYQTWLNDCNSVARRFEFAKADIARQVEQWGKFQEALVALASGSVTSWPGLLQLLLSAGAIGLFADNIRKNGVIGGLKRNR